MNFRQEATILVEVIDFGGLNHEKFISWVDGLIQDSEFAESWMIDLSLSQEHEKEKIAKILGGISKHSFEGSFTELIAIAGSLCNLGKVSVDACWAYLTVYKDTIDIPEDDADSLIAQEKIRLIEQWLEESHYSEEEMKKRDAVLRELMEMSIFKHAGVVKFVEKIT
ncbi:MAG: hypothetical protein SD837_18435 [Candidatus Electrothrix scaldis]|nr:MAG: hypothetical protein SD837_18435 [Candidatus Electrothrix sp. GW3-3]